MIETDALEGEPIGFPQETSGTEVADNCTHAALDHFIEAKNAAMGPLLNPQAIAMLYTEDAVLEADLPLPQGQVRLACRGRAEIEAYYEDLSRLVLSALLIESDRSITDRKAVWTGRVVGVAAESREKADIDAVLRLEFDEHDHVIYESSVLTMRDPA